MTFRRRPALLTLLAIALAAASTNTLRVNGDTLAYYRFESGGLLADSSAAGRDLTTNTGNHPQISAPGDFLNPIPLTGAANSHAIDIQAFMEGLLSAADDDAWTSNTLTIEAMIRPLVVPTGASSDFLVGHFDSTLDPPARGWFLGLNDGALRTYVSPDGAGDFRSDNFKRALEANKSYYVATTVTVGEGIGPNGEDVIGTAFLQNLTDGGPLYFANFSGMGVTTVYNVPGPLAIGSTSTPSAWYDGVIDEVRISNTALDVTELLAYDDGIDVRSVSISGVLVDPTVDGSIQSLTVSTGSRPDDLRSTTYRPGDLSGGTLTAFGGQFITGIADIIMPAGTTEPPAPADRAGLLGDNLADTGFVNLSSWAVTFEDDIENREGPDIILLDWGSPDTIDITIDGTTLDNAWPSSTSVFQASMGDRPRFQSVETDVTSVAALESATLNQGPNTASNNSGFGIDLSDFGFADGAVLTAGMQVEFSDGTTIDPTAVFGLLTPAGFAADFDDDGDVDGDDFLLWQTGFPTPNGATRMDGDADDDGDVDGDDFLIWQTEFPSPGDGSGASAVPEPSSLGLLLVVLLGVMATYAKR